MQARLRGEATGGSSVRRSSPEGQELARQRSRAMRRSRSELASAGMSPHASEAPRRSYGRLQREAIVPGRAGAGAPAEPSDEAIPKRACERRDVASCKRGSAAKLRAAPARGRTPGRAGAGAPAEPSDEAIPKRACERRDVASCKRGSAAKLRAAPARGRTPGRAGAGAPAEPSDEAIPKRACERRDVASCKRGSAAKPAPALPGHGLTSPPRPVSRCSPPPSWPPRPGHRPRCAPRSPRFRG